MWSMSQKPSATNFEWQKWWHTQGLGSRPTNTIRIMLVNPKDKEPPENRCWVGYQLASEQCDSIYISETERTLKKKLNEHKRESLTVDQHLSEHKHRLHKEIKDSSSFERDVWEAIQIMTRSPSLNHDQGRH